MWIRYKERKPKKGYWERDCWGTLFLAAVAGGLNLGSVVQLAWAASHDRMRREAAGAAHVGDLTGTEGTSTWLIDIVAVWKNRPLGEGLGQRWGCNNKLRQSYFNCVSFIRACLKHEMTKRRNGEMTFLNNKNKWLPLFCRVHSGKLRLAFTSPKFISTSPKNFLISRIDYTVLL